MTADMTIDKLPELPRIGSLVPPEMQRDIHDMMRDYARAALAAQAAAT